MRYILASVFAVALLGWSGGAAAQQVAKDGEGAAKNSDLYRAILEQDKKVFDAIDRCDMAAERKLWSDDAEFYHDKGGLMAGGDKIVEAFRNNLCGKVKRELVPGTLEVYPMNGYGAVEIGIHRFLHPYAFEHGEVGEAKFIHLWRLKDGNWQITRVISFDHGAAR